MDPTEAGFEWKQTTEWAGYWSLKNELMPNIEICLEPEIFGSWLLAIYHDGELLTENKMPLSKIPPGGPLLLVE